MENASFEWDRRSIIFDLLDQFFSNFEFNIIKTWQKIERLTEDSKPIEALIFAEENATEEDFEDSNFFAAVARANLVLTNYTEAKNIAEKSLQIDIQNRKAQRVLADVFYLTDKEENANEIWDQLLKEKLLEKIEDGIKNGTIEDNRIKHTFREMVGFEGDILDSPVFAAHLKEHSKLESDDWEWAVQEFYYSPHFRYIYAKRFAQLEKPLEYLRTLLALSQQMPWFKNAVLDSYNLIVEAKLETEQLLTEKEKLQKLVEENHWACK